jgi:hypothetical protein
MQSRRLARLWVPFLARENATETYVTMMLEACSRKAVCIAGHQNCFDQGVETELPQGDGSRHFHSLKTRMYCNVSTSLPFHHQGNKEYRWSEQRGKYRPNPAHALQDDSTKPRELSREGSDLKRNHFWQRLLRHENTETHHINILL